MQKMNRPKAEGTAEETKQQQLISDIQRLNESHCARIKQVRVNGMSKIA